MWIRTKKFGVGDRMGHNANRFFGVSAGDSFVRTPTELKFPTEFPITWITCGDSFSMVMDTRGTVFRMGLN
jgi:alpha-tubulin suppressor-like RCC1 family protein